jgi:DNA repair exonuclease SbcCD nuclease subunit
VEFHKWAGELTANELPRHFDYYAMGHLHDHFEKRFENLGGPVCYPGSIDPVSPEVIQEYKKGFFVVDLSGQEAKQEWIEIKSSRRQYSFDVNYEGIQEAIEAIDEDIQSKKLRKKPVVALKVKGKEIDYGKVTSTLSRLLKSCLYYVPEVIDEGAAEGTIYNERPYDINEEMLKLAGNALEDPRLADFAVRELLPLIESGQKAEALDLLNRAFETSRFGSSKP